MSDEGIRRDPAFRRFENNVRKGLIPKLESSAVVMSIVPSGEPDVKYAIELGLSIMMDKPIVCVVTPGAKVPDHLVRVADAIIEWDDDPDSLGRKIKEATAPFLEDDEDD